MSDVGEKAFDATPHRIDKARREGDVARSNELVANAAFASAACALVAIAPTFAGAARSAIAEGAIGGASWSGCATTFAIALLPVCAASLAAIAAGAAQAGGLRATGVGAKLERLNPLEGLKRMLSRETFAHGFRAAAAFTLASAAMGPAIGAATSQMVRATSVFGVGAAAWHGVEAVAFAAGATGFLFALAEYGAARAAWLRRLRMTLEERKREAKEQEGDPLTRGRRRALHRALLRGALSDVKGASFVVANPIHVAVALEYRPPEVPVPRVTVRAAGEVALRVRRLAETHRVPVVENVALARRLYRDGRVGQPIAHAHYVAVAEIVAALARSKT